MIPDGELRTEVGVIEGRWVVTAALPVSMGYGDVQKILDYVTAMTEPKWDGCAFSEAEVCRRVLTVATMSYHYNKVEGIRVLRTLTGIELKEAKDYIEAKIEPWLTTNVTTGYTTIKAGCPYA